MQTCLLMERTSYILFKKHLWVNDPWVLPVSSILLLPVKLLPWVLPQEIKTQRDLITRRGTGRPRLSSAALWTLSKPILPKHRVSLQGADAFSFFSSRGGWGFLCSHNLSRCSWVRSEATVQSSDGARGGLPMQTRLQRVHPGNAQVMLHLRSHKQSRAVAPFATGDSQCWHEAGSSSWSAGHADFTLCLCIFESEEGTVPHVLSGAEARYCLPVCTEACTQQERLTDHQKETRVGKKTPEECVLAHRLGEKRMPALLSTLCWAAISEQISAPDGLGVKQAVKSFSPVDL